MDNKITPLGRPLTEYMETVLFGHYIKDISTPFNEYCSKFRAVSYDPDFISRDPLSKAHCACADGSQFETICCWCQYDDNSLSEIKDCPGQNYDEPHQVRCIDYNLQRSNYLKLYKETQDSI